MNLELPSSFPDQIENNFFALLSRITPLLRVRLKSGLFSNASRVNILLGAFEMQGDGSFQRRNLLHFRLT